MPSALTTIFTPPAGCFEHLPQVWSLCATATDHGAQLYSTSCYWSLPSSCYPTGASIHTFTTGLTYANKLEYSPGVLPSGILGINTHIAHITTQTRVTGCLPYASHYPQLMRTLLIPQGLEHLFPPMVHLCPRSRARLKRYHGNRRIRGSIATDSS